MSSAIISFSVHVACRPALSDLPCTPATRVHWRSCTRASTHMCFVFGVCGGVCVCVCVRVCVCVCARVRVCRIQILADFKSTRLVTAKEGAEISARYGYAGGGGNGRSSAGAGPSAVRALVSHHNHCLHVHTGTHRHIHTHSHSLCSVLLSHSIPLSVSRAFRTCLSTNTITSAHPPTNPSLHLPHIPRLTVSRSRHRHRRSPPTTSAGSERRSEERRQEKVCAHSEHWRFQRRRRRELDQEPHSSWPKPLWEHQQWRALQQRSWYVLSVRHFQLGGDCWCTVTVTHTHTLTHSHTHIAPHQALLTQSSTRTRSHGSKTSTLVSSGG
jgi:hypothetical protein